MKQSTKFLILTCVIWTVFFLNILSFNFNWLANIHPILFIYVGIFSGVGGVISLIGWLDDDS